MALTLCLAVILDSILGDPRNFPHPVKFIGTVIAFWHKIFFDGSDSFFRGLAAVIMTLLTTGLITAGLLFLTDCSVLVQVYLLYSAIAWRDLKDETAPVFSSLINQKLREARKYLSFVVGRDTENLNENEIARATVETIAENSVDGVMSVIFFAVFGNAINQHWGMCLSVWFFKSASTLDSMLGYESMGRYGTAAARLDDILNFIPARLGSLLIILSGFLTGGSPGAFRVFLNDRLKHKSPNSANAESAFAGVLDVRLGGGAYYNGKFESRPFLNETGNEVAAIDILRAWKLLDVSCFLSVLAAVIIAS
ncbi:MAG: cobalamin biosynthesis protein CobD [Synergistaceae bacterium]|nr:cobalamin biosynthesis protein CobD [Synergistaceae bacterium]